MSLPVALQMAWAMPSAVPEGESFLNLWWDSMISISYSSPSCLATCAARTNNKLTPRLMLGACRMGIDLAAWSMFC